MTALNARSSSERAVTTRQCGLASLLADKPRDRSKRLALGLYIEDRGRKEVDERARRKVKRNLPLDEFITCDAGLGLQIVNVLRVVGEQLALLLQHGNESVCG